MNVCVLYYFNFACDFAARHSERKRLKYVNDDIRAHVTNILFNIIFQVPSLAKIIQSKH